MDRPPACYFASVQDGKQEIYLEWPKQELQDISPKVHACHTRENNGGANQHVGYSRIMSDHRCIYNLWSDLQKISSQFAAGQ